jgi:hypothetical protein
MSRSVPLALCLLLGLSAARADDSKGPRKIVEAAVKAHRIEGKGAKHKAIVCKFTGTLYFTGRPLPCAGRLVYQPPLQHCIALEAYDLKIVYVLNGERGWVKQNERVAPLTREQVLEYHEHMHAERVAGLASLLSDEKFSLAPLGELVIDGARAAGVLVRHRGRRDVKLYFDRTSGLLLKMESKVKENGALRTQEIFFSDYTEFGSLLRPRKVVTKRDRKDYTTWEVTSFTALELKADPGEFGRP